MTRPPVGSTGTLAELQVEAGDVVECTSGTKLWPSITQTITPEGWVIDGAGDRWGPGAADVDGYPSTAEFRLISRANPDQPAKLEFGDFWPSWPSKEIADSVVREMLKHNPTATVGGDQPAHIITHEGPDSVNHPPHYLAHPSGIECIQITEHMGFNLGNAVKYIWRADAKGDAITDLRKAVWYLEREIAKREDAE